MSSPSINGQLGWDNGLAHYILAWDHRKGQPRISQKVKLEYQYSVDDITERSIDFVVEYIPVGMQKTVASLDDAIHITVPRSLTTDYSSLYVAIASGYLAEEPVLPDGMRMVGNPYYITALSPEQGKELKELPRPVRIELNGQAKIDRLYFLSSYIDYRDEEVPKWVEVTELGNIRKLGLYAVLTDENGPARENGSVSQSSTRVMG